MRVLYILMLLTLGSSAQADPIFDPSDYPLDVRLHWHFEQVPIHKALITIAKIYGFSVIYPSAPIYSQTVTLDGLFDFNEIISHVIPDEVRLQFVNDHTFTLIPTAEWRPLPDGRGGIVMTCVPVMQSIGYKLCEL